MNTFNFAAIVLSCAAVFADATSASTNAAPEAITDLAQAQTATPAITATPAVAATPAVVATSVCTDVDGQDVPCPDVSAQDEAANS